MTNQDQEEEEERKKRRKKTALWEFSVERAKEARWGVSV